jgi:hypothetical protein
MHMQVCIQHMLLIEAATWLNLTVLYMEANSIHITQHQITHLFLANRHSWSDVRRELRSR